LSILQIINFLQTPCFFHKLDVEKDNNHKGYRVLRLLKCLLLQFLEDLSDKELVRCLQENNTDKWFCGFDLAKPIPNYTSIWQNTIKA